MQFRYIHSLEARSDHEILVVCPTGLPKASTALAIGLLAAVRGAEGTFAIFRTHDPELVKSVPDSPWHYVIGAGSGGKAQHFNHLGSVPQFYGPWEDGLPRSELGMMYAHLFKRPSDEVPEIKEFCRHVDGRTMGQKTPAPSWWTLGGPRGGPSVLAAIMAAAPSHVDGRPVSQVEWDGFLACLIMDAASGFRGLLQRRPAGFGSLAVYLRAGMAKAETAFTASVGRVVPRVKEALAAGEAVLVLDTFEPAAFDVCAAEPAADGQVLFIVHPSSRGDEWMVSVVPKHPGSRTARKLFPWHPGKDYPQGVTFVHPSQRFVAAATREAAVLLARAAVVA